MKKPVKLKKLIIDRNTWTRGGQNGSAALLNKEGNMCCLGFACERQGIPKAELKEYGEPGDFAVNYTSHATASTMLIRLTPNAPVASVDDMSRYSSFVRDTVMVCALWFGLPLAAFVLAIARSC